MKTKINSFEVQKYKLINSLQAKERIIDASMNSYTNGYLNIIKEEPQLLIAEQKLYRALNPTESKKAFDNTFAQQALDISRAKYGKVSVTKVVQDFFNSISALVMRTMQDIEIDINEESITRYLKSIYRKMLRQEIPQKIMKKLS